MPDAGAAVSGAAVTAVHGDFNEDEVVDLAVAYSTHGSGRVAIFSGSAPGSPVTAAWFHAVLQESEMESSPDFLLSGDYNADGHADLLAIRKGDSSCTVLPGNGKGGFGSAQKVAVSGGITAAASGNINRPDGEMDLAIGTIDNGVSSVEIFQSPSGVIAAKADSYVLPSPAIAIAIARLDEDAWADVAVATSQELRIIHGRAILSESERTSQAEVESVPLPFAPISMVTGDFLPAAGTEVAFVSTAGELRILSRGSDGKWKWSAFSAPPAASLQRARRTGYPQDDLLITALNGRSYIWNVARPNEAQDAAAESVFPVRLNGDALDDFVQISTSGMIDVNFSQPSAISTVDSNADDPDNNVGDGICMTALGDCTLRAAIQEANATPGMDSIGFAIPVAPGTVPVITPVTPLPAVSEAVTIDGTTQPAGLVHLRGTASPTGTGLQITSGSSTIQGMVITEFAYGIRLDTNGNNFIAGNIIGLDPTGLIPMGNTRNGIRVSSVNNVIGYFTASQRNIISANGDFFDYNQSNLLIDIGATGTDVFGNYIGTDATGSSGLSNDLIGIAILSTSNTIGIGLATSGNVISGNGIGIIVKLGPGNRVISNLIGTDPSGTFAVANHTGVVVGGSFVSIGGTVEGERNTISGNGLGIVVDDGPSTGSQVMGNYIGLNSAGTAALGNTDTGVLLLSSGVTIGSDFPGGENVISGNGAGITIGQDGYPNANSNRMLRNYIGTDPSGLAAIANTNGILITNSAAYNIIGDLDPDNGNLISGNSLSGIQLYNALGTRILNNLIGVEATGGQSLGNGTGIEDFGSIDTVIGQTGAGNVISNLGIGIDIHPSVTNMTIQGNLIGTDLTGTTLIGNTTGINDEGAFTTIGGSAPGAGNVISGNLFDAIDGGYLVQGNLIGTDVTGTAIIGNGGYGIYGGHIVGGDQPGEGNVISGNLFSGVSVVSDGAQVKGNLIGTDITGTVAFGNGFDGVEVTASNVEIGGLNPGAGNRIANNEVGVLIFNGTGNSVHGNSIYANTDLGIDLDPVGVTPNDDNDIDVGPNLLQNFPVLTSATNSDGITVIKGSLSSANSTQYTIEFFSNSSCDSSEHGEGETFAGMASVGTDIVGEAHFTVQLAGLTPGSYVTATATDSSNNTSEFSQCIQVVACPAISISPSSLPNGQVGVPYDQFLSASGGTPPYIYSSSLGAPPPGINISRGTGEVLGTPLAPGLYPFLLTANDSNGCTGTQLYSITITCGSITVAPDTLPDGVAGSPYSATVSANGGTGPYIFTVAAGPLPTGLTLDSTTGEISGTLSASGTFTFTIAAADIYGCIGTKSYTVTVSCTSIGLQPAVLPDGVTRVFYNATVSATGGTAPYTFAVTTGSLPVALFLHNNTGVIDGIPLAADLSSFEITATDAAGCSGSQSYSIIISCASITVLPDLLPDGLMGAPYNATISATGGSGPYTFTVTSGSLPPGLDLEGSSGGLTGTPSSAGIFDFGVTATDTSGCTGTMFYSVTIASSCLFCDEFNDNVLAGDWTYSGTWTEANDTLNTVAGSKKATAVAAPVFGGCQNCSVATSVSIVGSSKSRVWIYVWLADPKNDIELLIKEANDKIILKQRVGGSIVKKQSASVTINPSTSYAITMLNNGTTIVVNVDGTDILTFTPIGVVPSGGVGFGVKNSSDSFGYIHVN